MLSPYKKGFRVTSVQGPRWGQPHQGLDMVGVDKNIYAVKGGVAVVSSFIDKASGRPEWAFGNRVMIRGDDGKFVMYNHLAQGTVFPQTACICISKSGTGRDIPIRY